MSRPFSRYLHPFDLAHHPSLEPEVRRAILASCASDRHAIENQPAMRKSVGRERPVPTDDTLAALRTPDASMRQ